MTFRHDRRRRVLTDEASSGTNVAPQQSVPAGEGSKPSQESYTDAARRDQQPHITDVVPLHWLALTLPLLAGMTAIVALELIYTWLPELTTALGGGLGALDSTAPTSLAHWFSSLLLGLTAALSLLVYRLRIHRIDDYRGRYRVWRWAMLAAIMLSINETARLDQLAAAILRLGLQGTSLASGWVWSTIAAVTWGLVTVRLLFEIRRSLLASAVVSLAAIDLIVAATSSHWMPWEAAAPRTVMLVAGLRMGGHLLLLTGVALYARHVILDAEGKLSQRKPKAVAAPKRKRRAAAEEAQEPLETTAKTAGKTVIDEPHKTPNSPAHRTTDLDSPRPPAPRPTTPKREEAPAERKPVVIQSPKRPAEDDEEDDDADDGQGLTRAERKRLKRQQRQGRQASAEH